MSGKRAEQRAFLLLNNLRTELAENRKVWPAVRLFTYKMGAIYDLRRQDSREKMTKVPFFLKGNEREERGNKLGRSTFAHSKYKQLQRFF